MTEMGIERKPDGVCPRCKKLIDDFVLPMCTTKRYNDWLFTYEVKTEYECKSCGCKWTETNTSEITVWEMELSARR